MTVSKLTITYSKEYDTQRVVNTIKKIDWYTEHGYDKSLSFPKTLEKEKIREYSEEEIRAAVEAEYADDIYKENEEILSDSWDGISKELEATFSKSSLLPQDEYRIFLTKYGVGGSYDLPDTVIVNVSKASGAGIIRTVIHEIIHLAIQKYIDEYKIEQAQKERIVDLFFVKNFPKRAMTQQVYASLDTEKIDRIFDENFPDMEAVAKAIGE